MSVLQHIFKEEPGPAAGNGRLTLFYLLIILLAGIKQVYGLQHYLDITFFDETEYLYKGVHLSKEQLNDWGPAYNVWYYILSFINKNPVELFYINYAALVVLIPILIFIFLISYGVSKSMAGMMSLSFMMMKLHTANFTYVSHFCLITMLAGFIAASRTRNNEIKAVYLLIASYICLYARQEFLVIFLGILILWMIAIFRKRKITISVAYLIFIAAAGILYAIFGFITFKGQGIDRSYFAFIQHFYQNYAFWTKTKLTLDEFNQLDLFSGATTMAQCLMNNPLLFLKHMTTNALNYLLNIILYVEDFLLPPPFFHYFGKLKHILFLLLISGITYYSIKKKRWTNVTAFFRTYSFTTLMILIFFGWSFFSIIMVFPNRHYIVIQYIWYMLLLGLLLKDNFPQKTNAVTWLLLAGVVAIMMPTSGNIGYFSYDQQDARLQPNLKTIQYLIRHNTQQSTVLFSSEKGFYAYLPTNYKEYFLEQEDVKPYITNGKIDILRFFNDKQIDVIYMNEKMQHLFEITLGEDGQTLLNEPEKMGFKKVIIQQGLKAYLLTKN